MSDVVHLSRAGVSVVLVRGTDGVPYLLHWGASLGDLTPEALAELVAAIAERRRPVGDIEDAIAALDIVEAVYEGGRR